MKTFWMGRDSNTFTSALKGIRKTPSSVSSAHKSSTPKDGNGYALKQSSFSNLYSPQTRIVKRKNLTLQQLFRQYQTNPSIQYIVRLKHPSSCSNQYQGFDVWLSNLRQQTTRTKQTSINPSKNQDKVSRRRQLQKQISQNLQKMTEILQRKQTDFTQSSIKQDNNQINRQAKYSFSQYFSQYSELQIKDTKSKLDVTTKLSIRSDQNIPADKKSKELSRQNAQIENNQKDQIFNDCNKENEGNFSQNSLQRTNKIIGLQLIKNKRFKSTKKKRKACS